MRKYGWYEYHENPWTMRNVKSGQEIRIIEVKINNAPEAYATRSGHISMIDYSKSITFLYKDSDIEHSIKVKFNYNEKSISFGIVITYNEFLENPSYGLWRRIDDFLTDAALCWPDGIFESRLGSVIIYGAWHQGTWKKDFFRQYSGRPEKVEYMTKDYTSDPSFIALDFSPVLLPIETAPPPLWSYIRHENPSSEVSLLFQRDEEYKVNYIPENEKPFGFQSETSYLMRADGNAYIFMSKLIPQMRCGEYPATIACYTLIDENVFFTFEGHYIYDINLSLYKDYGLRRLPPEDSYFTNYYQLPYIVWKDTMNNLMEAWPMWVKGQKILLNMPNEKPHFYGFIGNNGHSINGGYRAGRKNSDLKFEFKDPNKTEETRIIKIRDLLLPPDDRTN